MVANVKHGGGQMGVAIVDDEQDARLYFEDILESSDGFDFMGEFTNASEAIIGIPRLRPDLVLMDVCLPNLSGIECTKRLKQLVPYLKVVIMTGNHDATSVMGSLLAGADAFLFKPITAEQCLATLRFVASSKQNAPESIYNSGCNPLQVRPLGFIKSLSPREQQVMKYLAEGLLYKEISDRLGISYSAVHKYQHQLFVKLHVSNRSEAIWVWQHGAKLV